MTNKKFLESNREHICLITNHGYAGVNFPTGGAPDTGGQIIYVNELAKAMDKLGYKVSVFTRGGFPFFGSNKIRKGVEFLSEYARYVYIEAGGGKFIPKEDIGAVLNEEIEWLYNFVNREAQKKKVKPYNYFKFISTHYWDAAVIGMKLIERWQTDLLFEILKKEKIIPPSVLKKYFSDRYKLDIIKNVDYYVGEMFISQIKNIPFSHLIIKYADKIISLCKNKKAAGNIFNKAEKQKQHLIFSYIAVNLGKLLLRNLKIDVYKKLTQLNKHAWTPHSLGAIKERNYWDKDNGVKRKLKFLERNSYETNICNNTPYFAATSEEVVETFVNYYNVDLKKIIYFPPCIDESFTFRKKSECKAALKYLEKKTGYSQQELLNLKIVFETSRMDKTKRKDVLIKAFTKVVKTNKDAVLIIGGGPDNAVYKDLIKLKKSYPELKKKVFILGYVPGEIIPELFSFAYIYVSPSEMEGFGMSVQQAIASKTPVVVSDLIPVAVQYLQNASLIVPHGKVSEFAEAINIMLKDEYKRNKLAEVSYEISKQFNWSIRTKNFIKAVKVKED